MVKHIIGAGEEEEETGFILLPGIQHCNNKSTPISMAFIHL
jgi:hypothetical protein